MESKVVMPLDVAVSVVNGTDVLAEEPRACLALMYAMTDRDEMCEGELVATWNQVAQKLRTEHTWLLNARPPREVAQRHGVFVTQWAWMDHLTRRYGPTVTTTPLDPSEVFQCEHHTLY